MSSHVSQSPTYLKQEGPAMHKNNKMCDKVLNTILLNLIKSPSFSLLCPNNTGLHAFLKNDRK